LILMPCVTQAAALEVTGGAPAKSRGLVAI
jgi:hypothetical protein